MLLSVDFRFEIICWFNIIIQEIRCMLCTQTLTIFVLINFEKNMLNTVLTPGLLHFAFFLQIFENNTPKTMTLARFLQFVQFMPVSNIENL